MLNKPTNTATNLLDATVTEINQAIANATTRLKGVPAAPGVAEITTQHILDEADDQTLATLQVILAAGACTDVAKLKTALASLAPAQQ